MGDQCYEDVRNGVAPTDPPRTKQGSLPFLVQELVLPSSGVKRRCCWPYIVGGSGIPQGSRPGRWLRSARPPPV
ncbi:hypothetical protein CSUI_009638 [Cystoisospora suis]|uniref:Uncharacterized protein n=1 Tax=Cystoisospora suis TaxID=483139 RepID=A0A2C6KJL0_9APIC|nr:hypothetical protein CSUI_009638 [Cystoisospora suis]